MSAKKKKDKKKEGWINTEIVHREIVLDETHKKKEEVMKDILNG